MSDIERVSAAAIRPGVQSGDILLVCAYNSEEKFQGNHLEGAVSLMEFKEKVEGVAKDTELIFYCG